NDSNPGTMQQPLHGLRAALSHARSFSNHSIFVAAGDINETGVTWDFPVSVYGGYVTSQGIPWKRNTTRPRLIGGSVGLQLRGLDAGVRFDTFEVVATDADGGPGSSTVGVHVIDSTPVIRHVTLRAGRAADGQSAVQPVHAAGG